MKKIVLLSIMACLFGIDAFAYKYTHKYENNSFACSLQNIFRLNSCRPQYVWNEKYKCYAMAYITVGGKPVCVD